MSKKKKSRKDSRNLRPAIAETLGDRNHLLDAVRGLAIVLMVVDHIAGILFEIPIRPETVRFPTRLAMPLFAILMGYFLASSKSLNRLRLGQVVLATVAINIPFYLRYRELEILASLLVCYLGFFLFRQWFAVFVLAAYFYPWDVSSLLFDFPLTIVVSFVALGVLLRQFGFAFALIGGFLVTLASLLVPPPTTYVLFFTIPALLIIAWGIRKGTTRVPGLEQLGRFPLTAYVVQYYLIFALDRWQGWLNS